MSMTPNPFASLSFAIDDNGGQVHPDEQDGDHAASEFGELEQEHAPYGPAHFPLSPFLLPNIAEGALPGVHAGDRALADVGNNLFPLFEEVFQPQPPPAYDDLEPLPEPAISDVESQIVDLLKDRFDNMYGVISDERFSGLYYPLRGTTASLLRSTNSFGDDTSMAGYLITYLSDFILAYSSVKDLYEEDTRPIFTKAAKCISAMELSDLTDFRDFFNRSPISRRDNVNYSWVDFQAYHFWEMVFKDVIELKGEGIAAA